MSWYAFGHAAFVVGVFSTAALIEFIDIYEPSPLEEFFSVYVDIYKELFGRRYWDFAMWGASPTIWLGLWLTTGKPRIMPWKG